MQYLTKTIPAGGAIMSTTPGKVLSVKSCSLPITAAFNGGLAEPVQAGTVLDGPFRYINFINPNTVAVTVGYFVGDVAVNYAPVDNQQKVGSTYAVASSINTSGTTSSSGILVSGTNNGHQRKQIVFTCLSGVARIQDLSRNDGIRVIYTAPITMETDAAFYVYNESGSPIVLIMETYYN